MTQEKNNQWNKLKNRIIIELNNTDISTVPNNLVDILMTAEDHRYLHHKGVDAKSLIRAFYRSVFCRKLEGGSTITMQLVRVMTGRYERTLTRKISEIYLARKLSKLLPKYDLAKLYLTVAYFGWNMKGIKSACEQAQFEISNLSLNEAAEIIARLKYPEPKKHSIQKSIKIKIRAEHIIQRHKSTYNF